MVYFDNASTTKLDEDVKDIILNVLYDNWGNPSSLHEIGYKASKIIENAKEDFKNFLNYKEGDIIFTSGGTEANNLAIFGSVRHLKPGKHKLMTTAFEHKSVLSVFKHLEEKGFEVIYIKPSENGEIDEEEILKNADKNLAFASFMFVNNELGTLLNVEKIAYNLKKYNQDMIFHCDAVQALGKIKFSLKNSSIDLMSFSAHKIFGPKGVGALYTKNKNKLSPLILGGFQQDGIRPGTENTAYIAAFAYCLKKQVQNIEKNYEHVKKIHSYLIDELDKINEVLLTLPKNKSPYILSVWVKGIKSEVLLHFLEEKGIFVSSGSACNKGKVSTVCNLVKGGLKKADQTIRISLSKDSSIEDVKSFIIALKDGINNLIKV